MAQDIWTIGAALDWTRGYLEKKDDVRPRLSAELLLSFATGLERIYLYTDFDRPLSNEERAILREAVSRRGEGEPIQYITGEAPFRHLILQVGPGVLIPRPETEVLVDEVLQALSSSGEVREGVAARSYAGTALVPNLSEHGTPSRPRFRVLDLCTGSAAIALSIASENPHTEVWATDASPEALAWASRNLEALDEAQPDLDLKGRVHLLEGNLAEPIPAELMGTFDVVVSNPPYIPSEDMSTLPKEVAQFEPAFALDGGDDGLGVFSQIVDSSKSLLRSGGKLLCELDENCVAHGAAKSVEWYQDVNVVKDLAGRDRIVTATAP